MDFWLNWGAGVDSGNPKQSLSRIPSEQTAMQGVRVDTMVKNHLGHHFWHFKSVIPLFHEYQSHHLVLNKINCDLNDHI